MTIDNGNTFRLGHMAGGLFHWGRVNRVRVRRSLTPPLGIVVLGPDVVGFVADAVGGGDEADFFHAATQGVGDGGDNGAPGRFRVLEEGEFGQENVGAVAADGVGAARHGDDAAAVWINNRDRFQKGFRAAVPLLADAGNGQLVRLSLLLPFGQRFDGLAFGGRGNQPGGLAPGPFVQETIAHAFFSGAKILAGLAGHESEFPARRVVSPAALVRQEPVAGIGMGFVHK